MDSSRIFVRNLPPTITEPEFRKFFSKGHITDVKLLPQRRIGYVGYQCPEEAKAAVKHFHRSFLRMSKISVELAKPIADPSLIKARHVVAGSKAHPLGGPSNMSAVPQEGSLIEGALKKRKRREVDESDPKLKEFLEVMQTGKAPTNRLTEVEVSNNVEPPIVEAAESDGEYEDIPGRQAKRVRRERDELAALNKPYVQPSKPEQEVIPAELRADQPDADTVLTNEGEQIASGVVKTATDDDWLRSRTNRLLDLVDADDIQPESVQPAVAKVRESELQDSHSDDIEMKDDQVNDIEPDDTHSEDDSDSGAGTGIDAVRKTSRLFVRNLPYTATEKDLRQFFARWGELEEIHVPMTKTNCNQGIAFVSYNEAEAAAEAFQNADGATFQGRMLHVLPSSAKRDHQLDEFSLSKLPLKQQNLLRKKAQAATSKFNWNSLYMNIDSVLTSTADRLGISKSEMLDPTNSDAGVKQALAETSTIQDTKAYFLANGVDLNSFKSGQRGDTAILVKNFPYGTTIEELRNLFQEHGQVLRVLMPPTGTIAIVQFAQAPEAKTAFAKLAYRRFKNSVLFLEKGPKQLFTNEEPQIPQAADHGGVQKLSATELLESASDVESAESSSVFVKNLSFATSTAQLADAFRHLDGFRNAQVKSKTDPKKPGQVLSMGFGFVWFGSKSSAEAAVKSMDGQVLHGHKLVVRASHRGHDAGEERRREDAARKAAGQRTKVVIKNLPFEATKKDIRTLMGAYGQLRTVRVPKNMQHRSKGYAFAEFTTAREAENALNALKDTHLLGRKLVLEFAEAEEVDPEEVIARMAKKTHVQASKVSLQQLIGGGRKRINLGDSEGEGEV
ncbi:hypothetical protein BX600DRAFT_478980 [Xylariales sp. PMI_506]|nr:hypothetical protein BX600DRAFT_478980 [Xylariales sp. PMI_506]